MQILFFEGPVIIYIFLIKYYITMKYFITLDLQKKKVKKKSEKIMNK